MPCHDGSAAGGSSRPCLRTAFLQRLHSACRLFQALAAVAGGVTESDDPFAYEALCAYSLAQQVVAVPGPFSTVMGVTMRFNQSA